MVRLADQQSARAFAAPAEAQAALKPVCAAERNIETLFIKRVATGKAIFRVTLARGASGTARTIAMELNAERASEDRSRMPEAPYASERVHG
jgi:hypothetical protein